MFLKLYLPIIAVALVAFSLNCYAELDDSSTDVFNSAEDDVTSETKFTTTSPIIDMSNSESEEWYDALEKLKKRDASISEDSSIENLKKRNPTRAAIVRGDHEHNFRENKRNEMYLRPQKRVNYVN
uniref:RxLR effector protein n=1 Tax=Strongyloides papillosus TaxID=174720 RepID=A0A0N5CCH4_STREA